jgi:NAD(P)-dependent dehydrogenase (short-subunit alcohol dehydrogenase family)
VVMADVAEPVDRALRLVASERRVTFMKTDVSRAQEVEALFAQIHSTHGRVDVLVNNAGVELAKKIADTTEENWDRLMAVNLKGVFLCSRAAIRMMTSQGHGVIVNVASELGLVGGSEIAAYCASKGGVVQLTKATAVDHASDGIRVNCVCPGPVDTPLLESIIRTSSNPYVERETIVEKTLLGRLGQPEEIASAILFLACDESSYMTGSVLVVDGGLIAR